MNATTYTFKNAAEELLAMANAGIISGDDFVNMFDVLEDLNEEGTYNLYYMFQAGWNQCTKEVFAAWKAARQGVEIRRFVPIIYDEVAFLAGKMPFNSYVKASI